MSATARTRRELPRVRERLERAFEPALATLSKAEHAHMLGSLKKLIVAMEGPV